MSRKEQTPLDEVMVFLGIKFQVAKESPVVHHKSETNKVLFASVEEDNKKKYILKCRGRTAQITPCKGGFTLELYDSTVHVHKHGDGRITVRVGPKKGE